MAGSVNKVILIGNLGRDPEVRSTNAGAKVANFPLATSETWRDRQSGERRERTEWHRIVIFNENLIDVAERFLKKGSKVYIEGQLQTRKWQGQDGRDNYTTEVVLQRFRGELTMLDTRGGGEGGGGGYSDDGGYSSSSTGGSGSSSSSSSAGSGSSGNAPDLDDDIPF